MPQKITGPREYRSTLKLFFYHLRRIGDIEIIISTAKTINRFILEAVKHKLSQS